MEKYGFQKVLHGLKTRDIRGHTFMTSSRWVKGGRGGGGGQVKNGKNSDGSGWLQGGGRERDPQKLDVQSYN